jgi:membrane protein YdbS with pleckstrin-like domain
VQAALVEESPFDRRHRMACVAVDTAGAGSRSDTIRIPYLDRDIAVALSRSLYLSSSKAPIEGISDTAEFEAV